jgi:antitoxin YefM
MEPVPATKLRNELSKTLDKVTKNRAPILITRRRGEALVLMPLEEYEGMAETLHLMANPANAARLRRGLRDFKAGKARARKLVR